MKSIHLSKAEIARIETMQIIVCINYLNVNKILRECHAPDIVL